jgi:Zn-dependent protease
MRASVRLGRIGGVTVQVNWTALVIVGLVTWSLAEFALPDLAPGYSSLLYWVVSLFAALGLMASILGHELSHAVVARRHDVAVEDITLWMFGGLARLSGRPEDPATELKIAVAGPAGSLVFGAGCLVIAGSSGLLGGPEIVSAALAWLGSIKVVLAVFNLLPGAPLDGGRVLTAVLWRRSGVARWARERAAQTGQILGQILVALGVVQFGIGAGIGGLWLALIGWLLTTAARAEHAQDELERVLEPVRVLDVMTADPRTADGGTSVEEFVLRHALTRQVSSFPVVDAGGNLEGLVTLGRLRQLPRDTWARTSMRAAAVPPEQLDLAGPQELVIDVLRRAGRRDGRVLVVEGRRLVGIITPTNVSNALESLPWRRELARR